MGQQIRIVDSGVEVRIKWRISRTLHLGDLLPNVNGSFSRAASPSILIVFGASSNVSPSSGDAQSALELSDLTTLSIEPCDNILLPIPSNIDLSVLAIHQPPRASTLMIRTAADLLFSSLKSPQLSDGQKLRLTIPDLFSRFSGPTGPHE